ncbi:hypothetical protein H9L19_06385 [Weissella diestrammenae]|uniref:Uncharacterized protein n=1 Tax=Weissella diestrammenae TaxID=1162633 RepID=A0A7G9T4I5_9LACO|nr:hypothetical protein [Weissella diestrammenae]MCM0582144.1 hypothetical protein [Weissella diestrammenae]QNN75010.1 hypothetical protein H9L19_06385 [Weissella diestrammenae]
MLYSNLIGMSVFLLIVLLVVSIYRIKDIWKAKLIKPIYDVNYYREMFMDFKDGISKNDISKTKQTMLKKMFAKENKKIQKNKVNKVKNIVTDIKITSIEIDDDLYTDMVCVVYHGSYRNYFVSDVTGQIVDSKGHALKNKRTRIERFYEKWFLRVDGDQLILKKIDYEDTYYNGYYD